MTNSKKKTVLWELVHSGEASRQTKIKTTSINNILQKAIVITENLNSSD